MSTSSHSKADLGAWLLRVSAEQVIGWARLLLAVAMLGVAHLDPILSPSIEPLAYILFAYLAFSGFVLILHSVLRVNARLVLVTYIGDLVAAAVLMRFTLGIHSPFFLFFGFLLLASALHWNWRGVTFTTAVLLVLLSAMAITNVRQDDDLASFIVGASYIIFAGGMIAYFGAFAA
jgi:hypothetical protein